MEHKPIVTEKAPRPIGPYSQAVRLGAFVFVSGQGSIDLAANRVALGSIEEETERTLENLKAILEAAGSSLSRVIKVTVYLTDIREFKRMNQVYARYFGENPPARACMEVSSLIGGMRIEIDAIAYVPGQKCHEIQQ